MERPKENLQNEYQRARQEGVASAAEFLMKNLERNRGYCERKLLEIMPAVEKQLHTAIEDRMKMSQAAGESKMLHGYYKEYDALSERQKTKKGFKEFVKERFAAEDTDVSPERTQLLNRLLKRTERTYAPVYTLTESGHRDRLKGYKSSRENYSKTTKQQEEKHAAAVALSEKCGRVLRQIEDTFGYVVMEEVEQAA